MRILTLLALALVVPKIHAQCAQQYIDKCGRVKDAAGQFSPTVSTDGSGARGIQQAQQQAFAQTGEVWQSAVKTCSEERKKCIEACASSREQCTSKMDPMIREANTQMLTNQDQARTAGGQTAYTDDIVEDKARREAAAAREAEGATVQQVSDPTYICPKTDTDCFGPEGHRRIFNPNGTLTVIPPNGAAGAQTILNPYYDAAGFRVK